jgi:hypothetical protein
MASHEEKTQRKEANAGYANAEEAFERFIDSVLQRPLAEPGQPDPNCSWCNWRRGDDPRNLRLCGFHQRVRNNLRRM